MKKIRGIFSGVEYFEYLPFIFMLGVNLAFMAAAFIIDSPEDVFGGFIKIITSRSILVTDYIEVGGVGAALLNVSIVGIFSVAMVLRLGVKPGGANIMAMWLSIGFAFFGKNVFNMLPLTTGVWLFTKYCKMPFSSYYLSAMLVATLSPTISEIAFLGVFSPVFEIAAGVILGFFVGFIFPVISAESVKVHGGYNLYNMGFAGGLIATMLATLYKSLLGIEITSASYVSGGNNFFFAVLLYSLSGVMLIIGLFSGIFKFRTEEFKSGVRKSFSGFLKIHGHSGRLATDYYEMYSNSIYINMAVLCSFGTTLALVLNAQISGPILAGILTMTGFGSLGKHIKNVFPIALGAVASAYANQENPAALNQITSILFASGLAPIAGMFGWVWGFIAGFMHVNVALYIGDINGGLNLYNNGFAASFVALFLLPIITIIKRDWHSAKDKYR
ncbi:MAG: DUF1576 domain-containing protein [Oscillospiraceae bacterium]|nr:DUF1576 domain-containing protein [Oscillospiraceae bacterium]